MKAENITASEEEYEKELGVIAEAYQIDLEDVKRDLPEKSAAQIREDIAVRKASGFWRITGKSFYAPSERPWTLLLC